MSKNIAKSENAQSAQSSTFDQPCSNGYTLRVSVLHLEPTIVKFDMVAPDGKVAWSQIKRDHGQQH